MKKILLTLILATMTMVASASSVRYFTRPQAKRVAATLDAQAELMIYCGYEYELATYVIINEVWAEPVNSKYYEIWLYGYDAYTGEEIYMPIDLACIWLYNAYGNRMYSAAQYLRFRSTVATPNFYWTMPPYNSFVRHYHDPMFAHGYTYHYEIHRFGGRPPMPPHSGPWPYHPYYMRTPHTPAPVPPRPFTPGVNYPQTPDGHGYIGGSSRTTVGTRSTSFNNAGGARSGNNMNNVGNPGTTSRGTTVNNGSTGSRGTSANTGNTGSRGTATNTGNTGSRGTATNAGSTGSRGTATNTGSTGSRGTSANTGSTGSRGTATNAGSTGSRGTSANTGNTSSRGTSANTGSTGSRGTSANTSNTRSRGTATSSSSSNRSNTTTNTSSRSSSTTGTRGTTTNSGSRSRR